MTDIAAEMFSLGCARRDAGEKDDARGFFAAVLDVNSFHVKALNELANSIKGPGRYEASIALLERATKISPDEFGPWISLANAYWRAERYDEAFAAVNEAIRLHPGDGNLYHQLGLNYFATGQADLAVETFRKAMALGVNDTIGCRNDYAHALLKAGQLRNGLTWLAERWDGQLAKFKTPIWDCDLPLWSGEDLSGTLLLHAEQGNGDTLQFIRFADECKAKANAAKLIFAAPSNMVSLLKGQCGIDEVIDIASPAAIVKAALSSHAHAPLLSAFAALGYEYDTLPKPQIYLRAPDPQPRNYRKGARLAVGVVWAASPGHERSRQRSVKVSELLDLASIPGARLWSLQVGPHMQEAIDCGADKIIGDATAGVTDFADTANLLHNLDLIIAVDTAMVHLAGAMGIPCFMFNPVNACWRWCKGPAPWYGSVELFDQDRPGTWTGPIAQIKRRIEALVSERSAVAA